MSDNLVLSVLNNREIQPKDFTESLGAYRLSDDGRKRFLQAFERKMNDEFKHPIFEYRCTYRRSIELQARLLSRHLQEGVVYKPLVLRWAFRQLEPENVTEIISLWYSDEYSFLPGYLRFAW